MKTFRLYLSWKMRMKKICFAKNHILLYWNMCCKFLFLIVFSDVFNIFSMNVLVNLKIHSTFHTLVTIIIIIIIIPYFFLFWLLLSCFFRNISLFLKCYLFDLNPFSQHAENVQHAAGNGCKNVQKPALFILQKMAWFRICLRLGYLNFFLNRKTSVMLKIFRIYTKKGSAWELFKLFMKILRKPIFNNLAFFHWRSKKTC